MEITQLHYFKTVAKFESFTRAAEELHITQSALSRSIAQLENDIGIQLFERRKGGKITLNRDGRQGDGRAGAGGGEHCHFRVCLCQERDL